MLLMTFGQKILSLRNQRGWSQRDLAKEIGGVSGSSVSAWENGAVPAMDAAFRTARALSVPLDFLADDARESPTASGLTDAERQLRSLVDRFGAERLLWRLVEVGIGPDSSGGVEKRPS
jgi:transcriptional regulator with XRE-family HTH domain